VAAVPGSRRTRHVGRLDAADVVVYRVEDRCSGTRVFVPCKYKARVGGMGNNFFGVTVDVLRERWLATGFKIGRVASIRTVDHKSSRLNKIAVSDRRD
jgi:hypothetical protein